jgi:hypothetical protein
MLQWAKTGKIGASAKWLSSNGSGAWRNINTEAHSVRWHHDVGIQHRGINAITTHRLQGELSG